MQWAVCNTAVGKANIPVRPRYVVLRVAVFGGGTKLKRLWRAQAERGVPASL